MQRVYKIGITQVSVLPPREKLTELRTGQEFIPGQNQVRKDEGQQNRNLDLKGGSILNSLTPLYYESLRKRIPQAAFVGKYLAINATNFIFEGKMTIHRDKWEGTYIWSGAVISEQDYHEQNSSTHSVVMEDF